MLFHQQRSAILVFAKAPVPGTVKTRLIPLLGEEKATELQAAMITNAVAMAARCQSHEIQLWCSPGTTHPLFRNLQSKYPISVHVQQGEDLGQRMHRAFVHALKDFDTAVLIGTDCPSLSVELLDRAFQVLHNDNDAVIVPAEDGGYVLIGLKKAAITIFSDIAWGTGQVYEQTTERFRHMRLAWETFDTLWDVDRPADIKRLVNERGGQWHPQLLSLLDSMKS
jgi:hypothetical protein